MPLPTLAGVVIALAVQAAALQDEPARVTAAGLPEAPPPLTVGAGEVVLEATVSPEGSVTQIDKLRATAPFTDLVASAVEGWRFVPAGIVKDGRAEQIESKVLVVAFYRPPALYMGGTIGEPVRDVGRPSGEAPSIGSLEAPPYPPTSKGDGTVLLEVELSAGGGVNEVKVLRSGGGFDAPAIEAVRKWRFMPPKVAGPSKLYSYVILGFREPVVGRSPRN